MVLISRILKAWRSPPHETSTGPAITNDPTSFSLRDLSPNDSNRDRLTFWRRLMCAPEVFDPHVEASPFPYDDSLVSSSSALPSSSASVGPTSRTTGSMTRTHSVFAKPAPSVLEKVKPVSSLEDLESHVPGLRRHSSKASMRWSLTDTRRMTRVEADGPFSLIEHLKSLKKARDEQIKDESRKLREMQRDEAELEREERHRLSGVLKATMIDKSEGASSHGESEKALHSGVDSSMDITLKSSLNTSFATSECASILDGDDAIDLHDLNHLYEHYKRREVSSFPNQDEQEEHPQQEGPKTVSSRKNTKKYPLRSKQYIERVILGQRSQQVIALMWLLSESMRHAWKLNLRLAQMYWYYVPVCLRTLLQSNGDMMDEETIYIINNKYYQYFCSGHFDYECFVYQFSQEWEELFTSVQCYLGENSPSHTPAGSVGVAATVLYSMELFGRQSELQTSLQRVEAWVRRCQQRVESLKDHQMTCDENHNTVIEPFSTSEASRPSVESVVGQTEAALATSAVNREADKSLSYIPINWQMALDDDLRANVSWTRKKCKLRQIRVAMQTLHSTQRQTKANECEQSSDILSPALGLVPLEALSEDSGEEEEETKSHHIVSVGCFGLSFLSRWD